MSKTRKDGNHRRLEPREGSVKQKIHDRLNRAHTHMALHELLHSSSSVDELDEFDEFPSFEKI